MRVAVVISGHVPSTWAHSINTVNHASAFRRLGHEVTVYSPLRYQEKKRLHKTKPQELYNTEGVSFKLIKDRSIFYYKEHPVLKPFFKVLDVLWPLRRICDPEKEIAKTIVKNNTELAYCRCFRTAEYLIKENIPVVVETHNPHLSDPDLRRLLKHHANPCFRGFVTIAPQIGEALKNAGVDSEKILVREDAVDIHRY